MRVYVAVLCVASIDRPSRLTNEMTFEGTACVSCACVAVCLFCGGSAVVVCDTRSLALPSPCLSVCPPAGVPHSRYPPPFHASGAFGYREMRHVFCTDPTDNSCSNNNINKLPPRVPCPPLPPVCVQVQRVCYSTCSVHAEENEDVVAKALDQQPIRPLLTTTTTASTSAAASSKRFELSRCLSRWPRRGLAVSGLSKAQAACLARTDPFEDETNGFFVAVFERGVSSNGSVTSSGELGSGVPSGSCSGNGGGGGDGGAGVGGKSNGEPATKKKRNRHKNRKKNKKKRKLAEAEGKAQSEEAEKKEGAAEGCEEGNGEIGTATSIGAIKA